MSRSGSPVSSLAVTTGACRCAANGAMPGRMGLCGGGGGWGGGGGSSGDSAIRGGGGAGGGVSAQPASASRPTPTTIMPHLVIMTGSASRSPGPSRPGFQVAANVVKNALTIGKRPDFSFWGERGARGRSGSEYSMASWKPTIQKELGVTMAALAKTPHEPRCLDLEALARAPRCDDPFPHVIVPGFVPQAAGSAISADYPAIARAGSFPVGDLSFGAGFRA